MRVQLRAIEHVSLDKFQIGQYEQVAVIVAVPCDYADPLATVGQAARDVFADETCSTKYANGIVLHIRDI